MAEVERQQAVRSRSQPLALGRITERTKCRWICLTVSASHTSRPRTEPSSCRTQAAIPAMAPRAPQLICLRHPSRPLVPPMPALCTDGARARVPTQRQSSGPATVHIRHAAARTGRARALVDAALSLSAAVRSVQSAAPAAIGRTSLRRLSAPSELRTSLAVRTSASSANALQGLVAMRMPDYQPSPPSCRGRSC